MTLTKQLRIASVEFNGADSVRISVRRGVVDETGKRYEDGVETIDAPDADLEALALANGAPAGRWANQEVGQYVSALTVVVTPGVAAVAAQPPVMNGDVVETQGVVAVAAVPEVTAPRFGALPVVW